MAILLSGMLCSFGGVLDIQLAQSLSSGECAASIQLAIATGLGKGTRNVPAACRFGLNSSLVCHYFSAK